jgi:hypothetical protein
MRPLSFLAVLSAVLAAGGAYACCFFKSAGPGPPAPTTATAAAAAPAALMRPTAGYIPYLEIAFVDGYAPDASWNVVQDLPAGTVEIDVDADANVYWTTEIDLYVTDLGPIGSITPAAKKEPKRYKVSKPPRLKQKKVNPKPAAVRSDALPTDPVPPPPPPPPVVWVWELGYDVDVEAGHRYSAYAQGQYWDGSQYGTATSHTVTFHTLAVLEPPSKGKGKGPPDKK